MVNRTATVVFFIDETFFGNVTIYVPGPAAADFGFTSSLPAQLLKAMAPALQPLFDQRWHPHRLHGRNRRRLARSQAASPGRSAETFLQRLSAADPRGRHREIRSATTAERCAIAAARGVCEEGGDRAPASHLFEKPARSMA